MPSTTPIPESILANVKTALEGITTGNGYRTSVATVDRQFINPESLAGSKIPALAIFGEELEYETDGIASTPRQLGRVKFKLQGVLRAYSSPETAVLNFIQDVREKLFADRTRGGYANNTVISKADLGGQAFNKYGTPPFVAKPFLGFLMDVEVLFQESL